MDDIHLGEITVADVERVVLHNGVRMSATDAANDADVQCPVPDWSDDRDLARHGLAR